MKMIPLSAWVSLPVGALLIGLEYIAPAVVTAASNISPLRLLSSSAHSTLSVTRCIVSDGVVGVLSYRCCVFIKSDVSQI